MMFGFKISIDGHKLNIIATDGHDVEAKAVDSFMIYSGERYDFYIEAYDSDNAGNYWVRAETIDFDTQAEPGKV